MVISVFDRLLCAVFLCEDDWDWADLRERTGPERQ